MPEALAQVTFVAPESRFIATALTGALRLAVRAPTADAGRGEQLA